MVNELRNRAHQVDQPITTSKSPTSQIEQHAPIQTECNSRKSPLHKAHHAVARQGLILYIHRRCFTVIMIWEGILRLIFVNFPKAVSDYIDGMENIVSFFFVYVMLQALAILWGFLFNIGAVLGDNMIRIFTMPFTQALCVLLVHASVIGIVLWFGRATWILTWQSTQNFPMIRRIIAYECRPQSVILIIAVPLLALLPMLIVVPSACTQLGDDDSTSWAKILCEESYLKFLTDKHPMFHRSLRLSTAIAICQFIQACLEILPRWYGALMRMSTTGTVALATTLVILNLVGVLWLIEWIARHFKYPLTPITSLISLQWDTCGMTLLTAWTMWFLALTLQTTHYVQASDSTHKKLFSLFARLKDTFVVGQALIFLRACFHPDMGFVHAQLELTIINLLLPSIYVVSLIVLRWITSISIRTVFVSTPLVLILSHTIYVGSKMTEKPHAFFVLFLFLFDIALRSSKTVSSLHRMSRIRLLLHQMLETTTSAIKTPPVGHSAVKKVVYGGFIVFIIFTGVMAVISMLTVMQRTTKWFPDATSVTYRNGDTSIEIHHTAVVKLNLNLANVSSEAIHVAQPHYASCNSRWSELTLVDYGLFAQAAYFDPASQDVSKFVKHMFASSFEDIEIRRPALNSKTGSKLDFYEAYIPVLNTSVIAVRGTDIWRFTDLIEDVKMFMEPVIFTILSTLFPTIRIWPDVTFSTLIELYSELISLFGLQHDFWYYHELLEYVASINDRQVVLTGHSMGGGIARLVGSITGKTSVTFSPPGFVQSYSKLVHDIGGNTVKVDRARIHHHSIAVVPEYDPVTMVDTQSGMIQKISCNTAHLSMQLSCHMLEGTVCNLLEHCGDTRHRISSCKFEHKIASVTNELVVSLTEFLVPETAVTFVIFTGIIVSVIFRRRRPIHDEYYFASAEQHLRPQYGRSKSPHSQIRHRKSIC